MVDMTQLDGLVGANRPRPPRRGRPIDARKAKLRQAKRLLKAIAARKLEGLYLFRPLPHAVPFMESTARWQLGDGSNQAAKTIHFAAKMAAILCGHDPTGKSPAHGGKALMIGLDGDHLANPQWSKMAQEGAFDIIRDEHTRQWRSVRPDPNNPRVLDSYDLAYKEKWKPAPPLLPPRAIASIAWEDRGKGIPRNVTFASGWELLCRSSQGKPPQGIQLHVSWLDEEIANSNLFIPEVAARGIRFGAMNLWSATPQSGGAELYEFRERADAGSGDIKAFTFLLDDNPYMSPEEKQAFFDALPEDEREVRYHGRYAIAGRRIYPHYNAMGDHGCEPFVMPRDYCRELILDPGRQHCGTLFGAVDTEEAHRYIYDGFDLRNADAQRWADRVDRQIRRDGGGQFCRWIIDQQMGKQTPPGRAKPVAQVYFEALASRGHRPQIEGPLYGFFAGSNDISAREEALLEWMTIRHAGPFAGTAKLQVVRGAIPGLDKQFSHAQMEARNPQKRAKLPEDLLVCAEYWAGSNPVYRPPEQQAGPTTDRLERQLEHYRRRQTRKQDDQPSVYVG